MAKRVHAGSQGVFTSVWTETDTDTSNSVMFVLYTRPLQIPKDTRSSISELIHP